MAPINEKIITNKKFRKLIDKKNKLWLRISFWTKASDVEFDDGTILEGKYDTFVNNVNDLKDDINTLSDTVNILNNMLGGYTVRVMTLAQYNELVSKDNKTIYLCT